MSSHHAQRSRRASGYGAAVALFVVAAAMSARAADDFKLSVPVACDFGKVCFVQNFVDVDPGTGVKDHTCGGATYDGHNGVDFRVRSAEDVGQGVEVIAAAPGRVKGVRDEMSDAFVRDVGKDAVAGKECGNGLVIDHGRGFETQYCHMRRGSLKVKPGETVQRGQPLGAIGFSGLADFPHLHLSVRRNGLPIDPYLGQPFNGACSAGVPPTTLWDEAAQKALAYRTGVIIEAGFTSQAPSWQGLEAGTIDLKVQRDGLVLMFFARIINVEAGDVVRLSFHGPGGLAAEQTFDPLEKRKAVHVANIGRRRGEGGWAEGTYTGHAEVLRNGKTISAMDVAMNGPTGE